MRLVDVLLARRPVTRFETLLAVVVAALVAAVFLSRAERLMAVAEQTRMEATVNNLTTAVRLASVKAMLEPAWPGSAYLEAGNPFCLMRGVACQGIRFQGSSPKEMPWIGRYFPRVPTNYRGEMDAPDPSAVEGGSWYFDTAKRVLVYRVEHGDRFRTVLPGVPRARFQLRPLGHQGEGGPGKRLQGEKPLGMRLVPMEPYSWQTR